MLEAHAALAALLDPPDEHARARALLGRHRPRELARVDTSALIATTIVSPVEALRVVATFALAGHALQPPDGSPLEYPPEVARAVPEILFAPVEEVWVVGVDTQLRPLVRARIARGRVNACDVSPADALGPVLRAQASGFWLLHNHPSGDPTPSRDDVMVSERFMHAAALLGLELHDHLVIAGGCWASCLPSARGPRRGRVVPHKGRGDQPNLIAFDHDEISARRGSGPSRSARSPRRPGPGRGSTRP